MPMLWQEPLFRSGHICSLFVTWNVKHMPRVSNHSHLAVAALLPDRMKMHLRIFWLVLWGRTCDWLREFLFHLLKCSGLGRTPYPVSIDLLSSSRSGCVSSASLGVNFPSWFTIPMNLRSAETDVGGCIFVIAAVLSGSAWIPLESMTCPRNLRLSLLNSHFCAFRVPPASSIRVRTATRRASCSAWSLPNTRMSSI